MASAALVEDAARAWDDMIAACDRAAVSHRTVKTYVGFSKQHMEATRDDARLRIYLDRVKQVQARLLDGLALHELPCDFEYEGFVQYMRGKHDPL